MNALINGARAGEWEASFGTRGSQVQILPLRPILNSLRQARPEHFTEFFMLPYSRPMKVLFVYACRRQHQVQDGAVFSARSARPAPWRNRHRFRTASSNPSSPASRAAPNILCWLVSAEKSPINTGLHVQSSALRPPGGDPKFALSGLLSPKLWTSPFQYGFRKRAKPLARSETVTDRRRPSIDSSAKSC